MNPQDFDGYISHGQIVSGVKNRSGRSAKGVRISLPATDHSSTSYLNGLEDETRSILRLLQPGLGMQLRWSQNGDFADPLNAYYQRTEKLADNPWSKRQRHQHFIRYSRMQESGELRRKEVSLFLHSKFASGKGRAGQGYQQSLEAASASYDVLLGEVGRSIQRLGGTSVILDDEALFEECFHHLNPSMKNLPGKLVREQFRVDRSIFENCLSGELAPFAGNDAGFFYDGQFHGFLALKSLPQTSSSGFIGRLTDLPLGNFQVVLNIEALEVSDEIDAEETAIAKLERALGHRPRPQMESAILSKRERVNRLLSGEVMSFQLQFLIHAWSPKRGELQDKLGALKGAINRMSGAKYWEMMLPTTARNCFLATLPGIPFQEGDFQLKVEDHTLANLLPISGGGNDSLSDAEAILHGTNGGLLGVSAFTGPRGHESPQHMLVSGMTGGGKSVGVIEILTQTEPGCGFTCIFDDGLSYATYVRVFDEDARTLIIEPNGSDSLNYLDTGGLALSHQHLAEATSVLHLMAGHSSDQDIDKRRSAVLSESLGEFYDEWACSWLEDGTENGCRTNGNDLEMPAEPSNHRLALTIDPGSSKQARRTLLDECFARMGRHAMPTHSDFHDWLKQRFKVATRNKEEIGHLVTVLAEWRADCGRNGPILDGINTIDFSGKILHIELGRLSKTNSTLRELASFVIAGQVRNEISRRPRSERKRVVFEELGSFLELKGADRIVRDYFERGRKFNCCVIGVIQQISNIPVDLARSVLGNCRQGMFFRQEFEKEVRALQEALRLPEDTATSLLSLPHPSPETGAPFIYWKSQGQMPLIAKGFNVTTPETLYVAGSSGTHFEEREKALSKYASTFEGVVAEVGTLDSQGI